MTKKKATRKRAAAPKPADDTARTEAVEADRTDIEAYAARKGKSMSDAVTFSDLQGLELEEPDEEDEEPGGPDGAEA